MIETRNGVTFGPYRLDPAAGRLWKGTEPVALQPRPLAVLSYLAARPGTVVARDEIIKALWADTYVTRAVLKVAVRAIREALGDDADAPRYVETVGRAGYRFIGGGGAPAAPPDAGAAAMVGRTHELEVLRAALGESAAGTRKIVFVTGEAGIGKTTLIDRFVAELEQIGGVCIARGQCLEQYGESEAYLPVLEAIGRLAADPGVPELADALRRCAPSWVSQLPALNPERAAERRSGEAVLPSPARMLREIADALELFTRGRALVLVLEDLQWSDPSTADLIACLARRRQSARLLVIGSMRSPELTVHDNPLRAVKDELQANGMCGEVALELLSGADVTAYVAARFGGGPSDAMRRLAARIHERSEGNALFMVNVANDLVARRLLVHRDGQWQVAGSIDAATDEIPRQLQELIGSRLRALDPAAREVLEAASVAGDEFTVAAVAAALHGESDETEDICEALASQRSLIADAGVAEWPDGSVTGRYRFVHALYRRVLYDSIGEARRIRLHRAVGLREEAAFAARAGERAAQLAMHFTRGHDHARARAYHELAGVAALDRHAAHEAVAHYGGALAALAHEPESLDRTHRELGLVVAIATLRMATNGYAAAATEQAFSRARSLCDALPASPQLYPVLRGLVSYRHVRAELADAHELGELLLRYAAARPDEQALRVQAHYGHGATLFHLGALDAAREHLALGLREYDSAAHREHVLVYGGYDPGVACSLWLAWTLVLQGELREAIGYHRDGLALARRLGDAFSLAWACYGAGVFRQLMGDWEASEAPIAEAVRLAEEGGFPHVLGMATIHRGWARVMRGHTALGIPMLREGVALVEATGAALVRPSYLAMLAAADMIEGHRGLALERFDAGLAEIERTGERVHEATLLIGKSHLLVSGGPLFRAVADNAEACLRRALAVARAQGARLLELRSAVALARHCQKQGRAAEARETLAGAHAWFAGGRSTVPEIRAARDLLAALAA